MGVIAMKVSAQGRLLGLGQLSMAEALGYVWSLPGVSTAIVGCQVPAEVDDNARLARDFVPLDAARLRAIEDRTRSRAEQYAYFKKTP
jgi:predicted aldo/keto reductase-like oxidoreductase